MVAPLQYVPSAMLRSFSTQTTISFCVICDPGGSICPCRFHNSVICKYLLQLSHCHEKKKRKSKVDNKNKTRKKTRYNTARQFLICEVPVQLRTE